MMPGHKLFGEQAIIGVNYILLRFGFHGGQKFMIQCSQRIRLVMKIISRIDILSQK